MPVEDNVVPQATEEMFAPFERGKEFEKLRELIGGNSPPLALIGAGASRASGYPDWPGMMDDLRGLAGPRGNIPKQQELLKDDPSWEAEVHLEAIGQQRCFDYFSSRFGPTKALAQPHLQISRIPFKHFLTTNYDPCIELALARAGQAPPFVRWEDDDALSRFLIGLSSSTPQSVVYLHGRFDRPDSIVLTESSYVNRYVKSDDARRKLLAIFMTHPVVFIGFSMTDPDLANLMREVTARLGGDQPSHYVIMAYGSEPERDAYGGRMRRKFGVEPIFYSLRQTDPDKHGNLTLLLEALSPGSRAASGAMNVVERATEAAMGTAAMPHDPSDPEKGRWGGSHESPGRRLRVVPRGGSKRDGYLTFDLVAETQGGSPPLTGDAAFHLHPTFDPSIEVVRAADGRAILHIDQAYGAFTVGVSVDDGQTRLELDLALQPNLPDWFRRR